MINYPISNAETSKGGNQNRHYQFLGKSFSLPILKKRQPGLYLLQVLALLILMVCSNSSSFAAVSITTSPSGGTNISADNAANATTPAYTTLGTLVITEGANGDFANNQPARTFIINAPAGWTFNTSASLSISAQSGRDITSPSIVATSTTVITVTYTTPSGSGGSNAIDILTITGIQVRAADGANVPGTANLSLGNGTGTAITGLNGLACGSLSQIAGAISKLLTTLPGQTFTDAVTVAGSGHTGTVTTQYTGINFLISKIRAIDQFTNVVTTYSGVKTLAYAGPSGSPSYTTSVSFTSGVSTTDLNTRLFNAQTTTITVTDGGSYGLASSSLVVSSTILINGPYLQMAKSTGMNVRFRTSFSHQAIVWYGTARNNMTGSAFQSRDTIEHEVVLTGLTPNTKYFYKIGTVYGDTIESSVNNYFYTSPVIGADKDTRIWVLGDCGRQSTMQTNTRNKYYTYNAGRYTDLVLLLGDNAYDNGTDNEFRDRFFNYYDSVILKQSPLFPCPGNHDYANSVTTETQPYHKLFTIPKAGEIGGVASGKQSYYSFDHANIHFVSLDSYGEVSSKKMYDTTGAQALWLKQDLAATTQKWKVLYWHHPGYTMGSHNSDSEGDLVAIRNNFLRMLERFDVDLILNGHSHNYERTKLIKGHYGNESTYSPSTHEVDGSSGRYVDNTSCAYVKSSTKHDGTIFVVAGSAGQSGSTQASYPHNAMYYSESTIGGTAVVDVNSNRLKLKYLNAAGNVTDSFTMFKDVNKKYYLNAPSSITLNSSWPGTYNWTGGGTARTKSVSTTQATYIVADNQNCLHDTFLVNYGNLKPLALNDNKTSFQAVAKIFDVQSNDSDPNLDLLTTSIINSPMQGTASVLNGDSITYTANSFYVGYDTITYRIADPYGLYDTAYLIVDVRSPNQATGSKRSFKGQLFMDMNLDGVRNSGDLFGTGMARVAAFNDVDSNGVVVSSDIVKTTYTDIYGRYSMTMDSLPTWIYNRITSSTDDAEQHLNDNSIDLTSTDLEIVYDATFSQYPAVRFPDIAISGDDSIITAYIEFTAKDAGDANAVYVNILGFDEDNTATFSSTSSDISSRSRTTASIRWPATGNLPTWASSSVNKTTELKTVVQEIINRPGWTSGNSLGFILMGTGTGNRRAWSVNGSSGNAPRLVMKVLRNNGGGLPKHVVIKTLLSDYPTGVIFTTDTMTPSLRTSGLGDTTKFNIGMLGPRSTCMIIGDGNDNGNTTDELFLANRITGKNTYIANTGTLNIEAIALMKNMDTLYAVNGDQFGYVNMSTGAFTAIGSAMGSISGVIGSSTVSHNIADVDGLTYDAVSNLLWATERRGAANENDLLFKISRTSGQPMANGFGTGVGFKEIKGTRIMDDVDDIALDPTSNIMYAVNNRNSGDSSRMITINMSTGAGTVIGENGINDVEGMGYYNDGQMYGTSGNTGAAGSNRFYTISRTNGEATLLGDMNGYKDLEGCDCFSGLHINFISGSVFYDADADGVLDEGDTTFRNIKVVLYKDNNNDGIINSGDTRQDSMFTTNKGDYAFSIAGQGRFLTRPVIANTTIIILEPTTGTALTEEGIFASLGQFDVDNDFGFTKMALGDKVWRDDDRDGAQDVGEPGVAGVVVTLYKNGVDKLPGTADDKVVASTITDAYGNYLFEELMATDQTNQNTIDSTSYNLVFSLPVNYKFTNSISAGDNANNTNSDVNVYSGRTGSYNLSLGERDMSIDAGLIFTPSNAPSIGDKVWLDLNTDGAQNTGEPGISGVTVTLYNSTGTTIIATTITDNYGNYLFTNVTPGDYRVGFSLPPGTNFTTSSGALNLPDNSDAGTTAGILYGKTASFTVSSGDVITHVDAGLKIQSTTLSSLGDYVWYDNNRDGIQTVGEPGIGGVTVRLRNASGTVIDSTMTNAYGYYIFNNLDASVNYSVVFVKPSGLQFTSKNTGASPAKDSDADPTTGATGQIDLVPGSKFTTIDAGMYSTSAANTVGALGNFVWYDTDRDGIQDSGEPGVAGAKVTLYNSSGSAVATTSTDATGFYLFPNLSPANYSVGFSNLPANYMFSAKDQGGDDNADSDADITTGRTGLVTVSAGATNSSLDAGIIQGLPAGLGSIGNKVWYDLPVTAGGTDGNGIQDAGELGVMGITVQLLDNAGNSIDPDGAGPLDKTITFTNALGEYIFNGLNAGTYYVEFSNIPSGFTLTSANTGADDNIDSDGGALSSGVSRTPSITIATGEDNLTVDLGIKQPSGTNTLGNFVWFDTDQDGIQDASEKGVPGVTVSLLSNTGVYIKSTTTDVNGEYLFTGIANGSYGVEFGNLPSGFTFTTKSGTNTTTGSDADVLYGTTTTVTLGSSNRNDRTLDAGIVSVRAVLGNFVWNDVDKDGVQDAGEAGISGVTVTLYDATGTTVLASTVTDQNGNYLFSNLASGNYVVGFTTTPGMAFTTKDANAENLGTDSDVDPATGKTASVFLAFTETNLNIDAGLHLSNTSTIGNYVWSDLDNDGVQDAGENGIGGVLVTLYNSSNQAIGSAVTDGNGMWQINNVPPGSNYYLEFASNIPNFNTTASPGSNPAWTQQNVGTNGTSGLTSGTESDIDSDITPSGGSANRSASFNIVAGSTYFNLDAGIINGSNFSPVPVTWLKFKATLVNNNTDVLLTWSTATELNNSHFEVERSMDGVQFTAIGRVESKALNGNSSMILNYDLTDVKVAQYQNNTIFYRVRQIDYDGAFAYSPIEAIHLKDITSLRVYPSPVSEALNIAFDSRQFGSTVQVKINDMTGRTVIEKTFETLPSSQFKESIDVKHLETGYYTITLTDGITTKVLKFVKE
jgi:hypothetical protein